MGREWTVNHCCVKSQEASAQGKKETWRTVRSCREHHVCLLCISPWGEKAATAPGCRQAGRESLRQGPITYPRCHTGALVDFVLYCLCHALGPGFTSMC